MEIGVDSEGVLALVEQMRSHAKNLADADSRAVQALSSARGAFSTALVRDQLARIEGEILFATTNHASYSEWFVSVLEENAKAFIEYDQWVAAQIQDYEDFADLTPRFP